MHIVTRENITSVQLSLKHSVQFQHWQRCLGAETWERQEVGCGGNEAVEMCVESQKRGAKVLEGE